MNLLLDTHAFLWFWWDDPQLGIAARREISSPTNRKLISIASCWEVAIKVSLKKLELGCPYQGFIEAEIQRNNFETLPIEHQHLNVLTDLAFHHRDPFDRILVAQSMSENIPLISRDSSFDAYGIHRIWD